MTSTLPLFLDVTPFGAFCRECPESLSVGRGIFEHGKSKHPGVTFKNGPVVSEVKQRVRQLRETHANDLTPFLVLESKSEEMWFCTTCFLSFSKTFNFNRHLKCTKRTCPDPKGGKMICFKTTCGRFGPRQCMPSVPAPMPLVATDNNSPSALSQSRSTTVVTAASTSTIQKVEKIPMVPPALMTTQEDAMKVLKPFVRPDEDVKDLSLIYYPLLSPDFEGTMKEYISYSNRHANEDAILTKWIKAGQLWMTNYASSHIANVSGNVRHRLVEFEPQQVDGITHGTMTFNLRRGVHRLVGELDSTLRFFYRFPTCLFDEFKSDEVKNSDLCWMIERAIIPRILYTAAIEEPTDHGQLPVACRFCLSRGFTIQNQTQLVMNECGWFSSRISAIMHLLRAGVCGYLVTMSVEPGSQNLSEEELDVVNSVQHGRVTNLLAPYVKRLRDMNARKTPVKNNTVNANGDITSGAFTFPKSIWSTIVPRITHLAKSCFAETFIGSSWEYFLSLPISVSNWIELDASVVTNDTTLSLKDLKLNEQIDNVLGQLQAIAEFCLFGLGVGAVRHEEVVRLKATSFQWHNSYLYYWTESLKQGSLKGRNQPKMVEHRLSLSLSRIFLLLRYSFVASQHIGTDAILPSLPGSSMVSLVRDIFDFDCLPHVLNLRHLFTSIGNILLPESNKLDADGGTLVSNVSMTEKSGHTQGTGRRAYGTYLENSDEVMYDLYHKSLGEISLDPPVVAFTPYSDIVLEAGLKELLGQQATFRSPQQKRMIQIAANSNSRHSYVGIPCGHGKSLSWLVPMVASFLAGRNIGLRIIILPYKFLLGHMVEQARSMVGLLGDRIRIESIDSYNVESVSAILEEKEVPGLLFLNLDSAAALLQLHMGPLQKLGSSKILQRIYVDEFQQLIVEFGFRPVYQKLRELGRIGVPVMCLSGSLPISIATSLLSYCRLSIGYQLDSIEVVPGFDPIGSGFFFDMRKEHNLPHAIVESVLLCTDSACHVICDTKVLVEQVVQLLSNRCSLLSVTGDTPSHEQMQCARDWAAGTHDVLVSTVVALVGNENKKCRKIVVGGFLYNISSLVQALGRLRPEQRGPGAIVEVIRLPFSRNDREEAKKSEVNSFQQLETASCLRKDCLDDYSKIFSPLGLQQLLSMKEGCYLQTLSLFYGYARPPCMTCRLCLRGVDSFDTTTTILQESVASSPGFHKRKATLQPSSPRLNQRGKLCIESNVVAAQVYAAEAGHDERRIRRLADSVFRELLYRCILCGCASCIGECGRWCYRCGDPVHDAESCSFNTKKLAMILSNKGVCFGCFDTRQRGMEHHTMKDCPLRRRLKRLLYVDRDRRKMQFEPYLRLIYADEITFLKVVSTFSDQVKLGRVSLNHRKEKHTLQCIQVAYNSENAPLLPPDSIHQSKDISVEGKPRSTTFSNRDHARSEYKRLMLEKSSFRRRRKFVFGAIHDRLFPGFLKVDPLIRDFDLTVKLETGALTTIQIKRITPDDGVKKDKLLNAGALLGRALSGPGNARGAKVGDLGSMHAIGYRSASTKEVYVMKEATGIKVEMVSSLMRDWMEDNMRSVLRNLVDTDKELKIANSLACMPSGPGSRMMISTNLANAHHIDVDDSSMSVALWLEEKPGQAKNWFFVLPNLSCEGSDGVVVRLHHGVVISWDARTVFHCTSKTDVGEDNRVFGCMWGSSKP